MAASPCTLPETKVAASSPSELLRTRPREGAFNLIVLGDSVSWGQGLSGPHKFAGRVAKAIENDIGGPVNIILAAHSGATINAPGGSRETDEERLTPGEIPNSFPTIVRQIDQAAGQLSTGEVADLVLVGGCINDVGVQNILNPTVSASNITISTNKSCGIPVRTILEKIGEKFPIAQIVLTGYYPLVSNNSDLSEVGALLATVGVVAGKGGSALNIPMLDPLSGAVVGAGITEITRRLAAMNAQSFYVSATRALSQAARDANGRIGGRVSFACAPFEPDNAYASSQTWLWPRPAGFFVDEVHQNRGQLCKRDDLLFVAGSDPTSLFFNRWKCQLASIGHPNLLGAEAYARAILQEIEAFMPYWRARFTPMEAAEQDTDRPGEDYRSYSLGQQGWEACQADCAGHQACQAWTFVPSGPAQTNAFCWLKSGVPAPNSAAGLVSGVKRLSSALEIGVDRPGSDYRDFALQTLDPRLCEQACRDDTTCSAWTYVPPNGDPQAHCWLKNAVPATVAAPSLISGVKPGRN